MMSDTQKLDWKSVDAQNNERIEEIWESVERELTSRIKLPWKIDFHVPDWCCYQGEIELELSLWFDDSDARVLHLESRCKGKNPKEIVDNAIELIAAVAKVLTR